jgi:hypothetical protein
MRKPDIEEGALTATVTSPVAVAFRGAPGSGSPTVPAATSAGSAPVDIKANAAPAPVPSSGQPTRPPLSTGAADPANTPGAVLPHFLQPLLKTPFHDRARALSQLDSFIPWSGYDR